MASDRGLVLARWARLTTTTRIALLVIAVQLVVRAWLILPGAYWQDDFTVLRISREGSPTYDSLMRSGNGHLSPGTYLVGWVLAQVPGSFLPAAALLLVLQVLASVMIWLMLRRAVGDRMSMVLGLALALFTPLMFSTVTWWAAGLVMLVLHLAMGIAGYCHLRFLESRRWWWVVGSVLGTLLGLVFVEKALFVTVFLVLLTVLVTVGGFRHTMRVLLRLWPVWVVHAGVAIGYLVVYVRLASLGDANARTVSSALELARYQVVDVLARGYLGGPWGSVVPGTGQWLPISAAGVAVVAQVYVAVGALAYRVSGRRSLVAWSALVAYVALNVALTVRGRGLFAGYVELDPRYVCDTIPLAAVCLAVMFTPRPGSQRPLAPWLSEHSVAIGGVAVLVLFNSSMVTAGNVGGPLHHREVTTYVDNARRSAEADPGLVLYDGFVPAMIMIGAFPDREKHVSSVLDAYGVDARYNRPSESMRVLDDAGVARPISLALAQTSNIDGSDDCGVSVEPGRHGFVTLDARIPAGTWVMQLEYYAGSDTAVGVTTSGDPQPVGLKAGQHTVFLVVPGGASYVEVESTQGDATVCITGVTVGFPVPGAS
jgi:hypothetical protein